MSTLELYTKNAKVWIPHPQEVWESAELLENYSPTNQSLSVVTESGENKSLVIKSEEDLPFLKNPPILLGENDLISLSYLHEPAVLYNLKYRFCQKNYIYTYCGIVLVAINPYTDVPIYDTETIQAYRGQGIGNLDPHIFGVAEEAYRKLEREQRDQSIIVSGESGAGKTVSAKYTMRYFATVGGSTTETQVEKKVLASSPIMEAIGNAKTTRNDNSSRFGKFIELQFNKQFHISGASMRTYLLEKSRVVFQAPDERNYHIFYQICAARRQLEHLHLDHPDRFHYLNQGGSPNVPGVDDLKYFEETVKALNLLGFSESEQFDMFKILAAILHLGNIEIFESLVKVENEMDQEGCLIETTDPSVKIVSELLDIDETEMIQWLCTRKIISMREVFLKPMTVEDAITSRDALAKHIYSELFNWIVLMINRTLESEEPKYRFVGVLDIYGFETFKINSFEQFCINYANEKLQQQFNLHVFKLEQEEYIVEGIEWKMIDFYDNQLCIDLIEAKLGVLDLLDEECKMPRGSDASWVEKLYSKCSKNPHFSKARFGTSSFIVKHFADNVQYESSGFLEKNRDTILEELMNVIRGSKNRLVRKLFQTETQKLAPPRTKLKVVSAKPTPNVQKTHKQTVCSQFRESLNKLMTTLNATTPHYVRCIKPNDSKTAFSFQSSLAVQQLRACGVLETIRLSSAGFPSRWTYYDLFYRYRVLCRSTDIDKTNIQKSCQNILTKCIKDSSKYQFGKTKIFFRAGQMAYMEKLRGDKMVECCVLMQKTVRMFVCRKKYMKIRKSVGLLQRYGRGLLARRFAQNVRENRAAIKIQKNIRAWLRRIQYQRLRKCILGLQCHIRGYLARTRFQELKYNKAAITIQRYCRGWLARREFKKRIHHIVVCQSAIRRYLARKQYKKLRIEARSIEHVKKLNKGLENKIISLQQRIDELNKINNEHKHCQTEIQELKTKVQLFRSMETELKTCRKDIIAKSERIANLEEELKTEKEHTIDLIHSHNQFKQEVETERKNMAADFMKLREEVENFNEIDKENIKGAVKEAEEQFKEEKLLFIKEIDSNREQYQKLLNDYHNLEHYVDEMKLQLNAGGHGMHKRNISDTSSIAIDVPEDGGYGSVRSTESTRENVENIDWKTEGSSPTTTSTSDSNTNKETEPENHNIDIGLVLQLQHKLAQSERNNERIRKRLDELNSLPKMEKARSEAENAIRISELELANSQLKSQLCELQNSINEGQGINKLQEQLSLTAKELERRTEEIIQLKSVLANQANSMKSIFSTNLHPGQYINEDDELAQAYETQKTINKQLELELQDEKTKYLAYEKQLKTEIQKLQDDNEKQQRLLTANLLGSGQTQNEAFLKYEITRLTSENLELRDRMDVLNENLKKFKKREGVLVRKLKEAGLELSGGGGDGVQVELGAVQPVVTPSRNALVVRKKDREYLGMFSFQNQDINGVMKQLVHDLKPRTAVALLPGLPAYIIFMCVRYTDYRNDEDLVKTLLSAFNVSLKKVIKKRVGDFETTALWLSNTVKLVHNMKQYSGEKQFQTHNTPKQNEQCLRNFDLSEYRQVFTDTAVWIYHGLTRVFTEKIQSLIVPAILEHEEIPGISGNKPSGFRNRLGSSASISSPTGSQKPTQALLQELTNHHKILTYYGVDIELISQIFKQIFYFICASSLNNLLLRKELCHWSKGFQIRHNLSHFEMWTREKNLDETAIQETLQPIIQAAHLLQARKLEEDVSSICEMCSALTGPQITKLLNLYTPVDEFEQRVSANFIKQVQAKLKERSDAATTGAQTLLMDVKYKYPVRFVFSPSGICLEDIEIPEVINLPTLEKI